MDIRKGVDIGDDRLTASIEQPVLITRCVFHTLLQFFVTNFNFVMFTCALAARTPCVRAMAARTPCARGGFLSVCFSLGRWS